MRRYQLIIGLILTSMFVPSSAHAGWAEFWHRFHVDWHRNNCWPEPFSTADRALYYQPFAIMVDNGWRLHNTITEELFNSESQELTVAGTHLVHWIVTQAPAHRRTVFVLRGANPEATAVRVDSVQRAIASMLSKGQLPPVVVTGIEPPNVSGEYFDRVREAFQSTTPAVTLPGGESGGGEGG